MNKNSISKSVWFVLLAVSVGFLNCRASNTTYPQWLSELPSDAGLYYGVGIAKLSKNDSENSELKKLAYNRALDQVAQNAMSNVNGMYSEVVDTGKLTTSMTFKITSDGIADFGKVEEEYIAEDENYIVLISYPKNKLQTDKAKVVAARGFNRYVSEDDIIKQDRSYQYISKKGNVVDKEILESAIGSIIPEDKNELPQWLLGEQGDDIGIGGSVLNENESLFLAVEMAVCDARRELAMKINVTFPTRSSQLTVLELTDTQVTKIYIGKSSVYAMVRMVKNLKSEDSNDKVSWEIFKKQYAQ